jgi:hypothetical protein
VFTTAEATKERVDAYVASLEREKTSYETRIARIKGGRHDPLDEKQLELRVKDVNAELARVKKLKPDGADGDDGDA